MNQSTRHEKPLSKTKTHGNNPNQITINQHVIPNKHILEWSADGKMVNVNDIATNAKKQYLPQTLIFVPCDCGINGLNQKC